MRLKVRGRVRKKVRMRMKVNVKVRLRMKVRMQVEVEVKRKIIKMLKANTENKGETNHECQGLNKGKSLVLRVRVKVSIRG